MADASSVAVHVPDQKASHKEHVLDRSFRLSIAGGGAGAVTKTLVSPFERVKILCQTGESSGLIQTVQNIVKREGVLGFWKGNFANVIRIIPSKGVLFMCSDSFKELLRAPEDVTLPAWKSVVSGSLSGATAVVATYPLDLVRGRVSGKLGKESRYKGIFSTVKITVKEEGFFALYRGVGATLAGAFPYEGIKFGVYDVLKKRLPRDEQGQTSHFWKLACGAAAGTAAGLAMFPNDTVRRRMQLQGSDGRQQLYRNALHCYYVLWREGGIKCFYRGLSANLLRVVPNSALQFFSFELFKSLLDVQTKL